MRGDGSTTRQLISAPPKAVFVWVNHNLSYPKELAKRVGRPDIEIVSPEWLDHGWVGRELSGLILDHALHLNSRLHDIYRVASVRVRPPTKCTECAKYVGKCPYCHSVPLSHAETR